MCSWASSLVFIITHISLSTSPLPLQFDTKVIVLPKQQGFSLKCLKNVSALSPAMLGSPGASLQSAINATVGTGPPGSSPGSSMNSGGASSGHIDPSSMQRAYAALGLPYGNQSPAQGQGGPGGQNTAQGGQQLRSINALGKNVAWSHWRFRLGYCKALEDNGIRASAE